jgi:hypothetical protein
MLEFIFGAQPTHGYRVTCRRDLMPLLDCFVPMPNAGRGVRDKGLMIIPPGSEDPNELPNHLIVRDVN